MDGSNSTRVPPPSASKNSQRFASRLNGPESRVTSIRRALNGRVPLIGFSGSPWTLACYMVEGAGSDDYRLVKTMLYARPDLMHRILAVNADAVAAYLNAQINKQINRIETASVEFLDYVQDIKH